MNESNPDSILVVGSGIAGVSAAEAAHAKSPGTPVVLLSKEASLPCFRLRLIELLDGGPPDSLRLHPADWYAAAGIGLRPSTAVVAPSPVMRVWPRRRRF